MTLKAKYEYKHEDILRDSRPFRQRFSDGAREPYVATSIFAMAAIGIYTTPAMTIFGDLIFFSMLMYFWWLKTRPIALPFKLPKSAKVKDPNYIRPDGKHGIADGILYIGNTYDTGEEIWFTNSDARTHCLYLGTTGSGKTFGLKSFSCNALCWGSGYIYIDGKADTDLWSTLSAMARRFGRHDDLLIMNYMTGNVGGRVPSNTLNPFSSGSSSYLTNMLVSLMPDAGGDNAMWKERAISLISAIMPCLVWKRDNQNMPLSIGIVRKYLTFKEVIKLSRDSTIPEMQRTSVRAYLNELPGYIDTVFDDEGNEKPMPPDAGAVDTSVPRQQHGYLSMQFTRSMSSLGDDYGFIFDTQAADVDMVDVVLNRRILVVLIPALEKSSDETANLGKIISSTLKGMMGATLGSTIEGDTATAIENKPTTSSTPFMAIFDEVGYYTAQGMAVMAAQARSLGFSLIFAAQDMPALEKRVKEEARSITANCNIKLFGKLEDPTQTKDFFEKTVGQAIVTEVSGFSRNNPGMLNKGYMDSQNASVQLRARVTYDFLKGFTEGRAICAFGKLVNDIQIYNSDIGHAKAMRVHRFLPIPPPTDEALEGLHAVDAVLRRYRNAKWRADETPTPENKDIAALARGFADGRKAKVTLVECGAVAVAAVAETHGSIKPEDAQPEEAGGTPSPVTPSATPPSAPPVAGAPRRSPPVTEEAAQKAATAIAEKTGKGPLSWAEIIGAGEAESSPVSSRPVQAVEEAGRNMAEEAQQGVSWESALGIGAPPTETRAPEPPTRPLPTAAPPSPKAPLTWGDIIGADDDKKE